MRKVLAAAAASQDVEEGIVTVDALRAEFDSGAWAALQDDSSTLCGILRHSCFKDEKMGMSEDQLSVTFLLLFGLLHCKGKLDEKAIAFYNILQEGGLAAHENISATDKDFAPAFEKLCLFATVDIFGLAQDFGGHENQHSENDDALRAAHESVREDFFLDQVYGRGSRLDNEPWLKAVAGDANWCLQAELLRAKVFEAAGLPYSAL